MYYVCFPPTPQNSVWKVRYFLKSFHGYMNPYFKNTNPSSHFVLPMLAPQQYAYLWKAQIKTSPKVGRPSKIMAFEGQESLFNLRLCLLFIGYIRQDYTCTTTEKSMTHTHSTFCCKLFLFLCWILSDLESNIWKTDKTDWHNLNLIAVKHLVRALYVHDR